MDTSNEMFGFFKKMFGLQLAVVLLLGVVGSIVMVVSHQFILGVLPASSEWSPIVGWGIAAIVGYGIASLVGGLFSLGLFAYIFSD